MHSAFSNAVSLRILTSHMEKSVIREVERLTRRAVFSPVIVVDSPCECKVEECSVEGICRSSSCNGNADFVCCKMEEPLD